jgi:dCMP deaminase
MNNNINWDDYFMSLAILVSMRSKDPSSKVGAVLVNSERKIIGTGYNGYPAGCNEAEFGWERDIEEKGWMNTKYPYVVHAEANAILNTVSPTRGAELFVTLYPCNECAKFVIQSGIKKVNYLQNKYAESDICQASKKLLEVAGVEVRHLSAKEIDLSTVIESFQNHQNTN